jgi:prepilin signal peptidase PulO-like enzyme (type II secretory pathway)
MTPAGAVLGAALLAIAVIDFRTYRIPDWLSLPLIAAGLAWAVLTDRHWPAHLTGAAAGYASLALFGALYFRLRGREGLGLGDAKLFAAGGAWLGWQALPLVLALAAVAGLIFALATKRREPAAQIAFGPWLALGIWLAWLMR